jgi:dihydrofolate reductase
MTQLIYSMSTSLDGFIAGPGGEIDWGAPTEELHQFHNDQVRELGAHFLGRRLYETMLYWETDDPTWGPIETEFAAIWRALPKVVFSTTLDSVEGSNTRLASGGIEDEVAALRDQQQDGKDLAVGGAGLAAAFMERRLIDDFRLFVNPIVLGGGTPYFPALSERIGLELVETRTFGPRVQFLRYHRI